MIMKKEKYNEMSNAELKLSIETLNNEFMSKKTILLKLCEEMEIIEKKYLAAKQELENRRNIYL